MQVYPHEAKSRVLPLGFFFKNFTLQDQGPDLTARNGIDVELYRGFSSVQLHSRVLLFATPWTAACQASLSITNTQSLHKLMSIESVMPSNHLILCCPLLLPSVFPSISSVQFSHSVVSDSLWPHESQHTRPPCPSPTPRVHSNSCSSSQWCHSAISFSVIPFSSCPQSLPAPNLFQHQGLFQWVNSSHEVAKVLEFQL